MHQCNNFNVISIVDRKQLSVLIYFFLIKLLLCRALRWEEARQQCLVQGTDLAEMNSIEEQRALTEYLNNWRECVAGVEVR